MTSNGSKSVLSCQNILTHPRGGGDVSIFWQAQTAWSDSLCSVLKFHIFPRTFFTYECVSHTITCTLEPTTR